MTSQRWTGIRPPISPFPHRLYPAFSPGPQQTECQVALPALPKVLPLIPLPPSSLLTHRYKHTHNVLSFMPTIFHLLKPASTLSSLEWFISLVISDPKRKKIPSFASLWADTSYFPLLPDHPWQLSAFFCCVHLN